MVQKRTETAHCWAALFSYTAAMQVQDKTRRTRTQREIARELLLDLFRERRRILIAEVVEAGRNVGVSRTTLRRVCTELGVHEIHNGRKPAFWQMPTSQPLEATPW